MNLVLLEDDDFIDDAQVSLSGRRLEHIVRVLGKGRGESLRVGWMNGLMGEGQVITLTEKAIVLDVDLSEPPPEPLAVTLILALPRPKMLRRVLRGVSSMGVKAIHLINSYRVEKSYWSSPLLRPDEIREQLILGLEQGRDTLLPQVALWPRFRPFVEDELPAICAATTNLVAHPTGNSAFPHQPQVPACLAVGPEGGFIPYEVDRLKELDFSPVCFGERILGVETAVPALLSRFIAGITS